jgi:hypothetical protein
MYMFILLEVLLPKVNFNTLKKFSFVLLLVTVWILNCLTGKEMSGYTAPELILLSY